MSSWDDFFIKNSKLVAHIYNQLKDTQYIPPIEEVFGIFKRVSLNDVKIVMVGDSPYSRNSDVCNIAFATKDREPTALLNAIYQNLQNTVSSYKPMNDNQLNRWVDSGVFLCNFCFTRPTFDEMPEHYYLLWEPFINNLVEYISNAHPVVFMLFGSRARSVRESINEIMSSVVLVPHPVYESAQFGDSQCFVEALQLACNLGFTFQW